MELEYVVQRRGSRGWEHVLGTGEEVGNMYWVREKRLGTCLRELGWEQAEGK